MSEGTAVRLTKDAPVVKSASTNPGAIQRQIQWLRET